MKFQRLEEVQVNKPNCQPDAMEIQINENKNKINSDTIQKTGSTAKNFKRIFAFLAIVIILSLIIFLVLVNKKNHPTSSANTKTDLRKVIQIDSEDFSSEGQISNIPNNLKSYEPNYIENYLEENANRLSWDQKDLLKHIMQHPEEIQTDKFGNKYIVHKTYKREQKCFQQGFFFLNNDIYESCGRYGFSKFGKVILSEHRKKAIEIEMHHNYPTIFAEGADYFVKKEKIIESIKQQIEDHKTEDEYFKYPVLRPQEVNFIQLTWRARIIYIYDHKFRTLHEIKLPKEIQSGWGMTHNNLEDEENLWKLYKAIEAQEPEYAELFKEVHTFISDGTNVIYECIFEDDSVTVLRQHPFFITGSDGVQTPLNHINELEFVGNLIWANVFLEDNIYVLDPNTDEIVRHNVGENMTVTDETLNGIAYNQKTKKLLITGKLWNFLYEVAIL